MPSTERTWRTVGVAVAVAVLVYAVLITAELLLGMLTAILAYFAGWTIGRVGPDRLVERMGTGRATLTAVFGVVSVGYGTVVVQQLLLGLFLALLVFALAWITAPEGPLVRLVRWVLAARDDLRAVKAAVTDDDSDDSPAPGDD